MEKTPEKREYQATDIEEIKKRLAEDFDIEKIENVEKETEGKEREESKREEEQMIREKLEKEVDLIQSSTPQLQDEAQEKAQKIKELGAEGKLRGLLDLAQAKSLPFAVAAARAMDDPYILDVFHDLLIKEGFYKKFS
ncbi:MAG: hypothetical protein U9Q96_02275 [Patescibacteria group bacterium]|nr:hypothetical protein [Patescibacteria group bacterium]